MCVVLVRVFGVVAVGMLILGALPAEAATKRILIVGDSWAMSISAENWDNFPSNDVFDDLLAANGLGDYETQGALTARGGRKASFWADPANLATIESELNTYTSIDAVHLITGGIDFLVATNDSGFPVGDASARDTVWEGVKVDIQTIVDACLAVRPNIKIVLADYDYLNYDAARSAYGYTFNGATDEQMNTWLSDLGQKKREIAANTDRCYYVQNWGTLQYWFGTPPASVPYPGQAPGFSPYPGGDITAASPASIFSDGVHPFDPGHQKMLQNAIDQYYGDWLTPTATYTLSLDVAGPGGTIQRSPSGTVFDEGIDVSLTAIPAENYEFIEWSGDASGTENPTTITMNADMNVTAHFALQPDIVPMAKTWALCLAVAAFCAAGALAAHRYLGNRI